MSIDPTGGIFLQYPLFEDAEIDTEDIDYDNCPFHHITRPRKRETYDHDCAWKVQILYIIAAVIWIVLIFFLGFWRTDLLGWIILAIPLIVFAINFSNATNITKEVEGEMLKGNFISFGFLIAIILINWSKIEDKSKYFTILFLSLVFIMLSLVDLWVDPKYLSITKHIRSIFQTAALSLLIYALYLYYVDVMISPNETIPKAENIELGQY